MRKFLVFQLYAPLASWGDIAVGEVRPTLSHPTRSALLGLLGAAMGIRRDAGAALHAMREGYGFGVKVTGDGTPLRDYHTIQTPSAKGGKRGSSAKFATRREELHAAELNTIVSTREYRSDAQYVIVVWERAAPPYSLPAIAERLATPVFTLYLGRKACPPALPLCPQIVDAATLRDAFGKAHFPGPEFLAVLVSDGGARIYWDEGIEAGYETQQIQVLRDEPEDRRRWYFRERNVHHATERRHA
jgi:CRISPR system Cascade subunit CasD